MITVSVMAWHGKIGGFALRKVRCSIKSPILDGFLAAAGSGLEAMECLQYSAILAPRQSILTRGQVMSSSEIYSGSLMRVQMLDDGIAELQFDGAGVNVFNNATVAELTVALDAIERAEGINGLLVTSTKSVFIVGADITEFGSVFRLPKEQMKAHFTINNNNLNRFEQLSFPSVVAINGFALGGGLEFCLACDYRVMSTAAKIGLPETGLGIIPGWGGTVRLPRIAGIAAASVWIASARHQSAKSAMEVRAVDAIAEPDELREKALAQLNHAMQSKSEVEARRLRKAGAVEVSESEAKAAVQGATAKILGMLAKQEAPLAVVEHLIASSQKNFATALDMEADCFCDLAVGYQARALVGNFLNDQQLSKVGKSYAKQSNLELKQAAVIGAGIMGGGIAYQNALRGIPVVMKDINDDALELGMKEATKLLSKKVKRGRLTQDKSDSILGSITPTLDMEPLKSVQVVVEAVVENLKVKQMVLAELEETVPDNAILASNTSTILISRMAESLKRPENFAGLHFFNPVHAMPLVEIIRGEKTSDSTVAALVDYVLKLGKKPVVVNDCPAFLVNRVLFPYFLGFEKLLLDGANFQEVDRVMELWGWPMGPAYLADVIGIDTLDHCQEVLSGDFPSRMSRLEGASINALYSADCLGQKNGKGYYNYPRDEKGRSIKVPSDATIAMLAKHAPNDKQFSDDEIAMRCMLPMAIEMARCLEEGVVGSPAEADMALIYGLGFPTFRGGVVRWMDETGMQALCDASDRLAGLGEAYVVTSQMRKMAEEGKTYY